MNRFFNLKKYLRDVKLIKKNGDYVEEIKDIALLYNSVFGGVCTVVKKLLDLSAQTGNNQNSIAKYTLTLRRLVPSDIILIESMETLAKSLDPNKSNSAFKQKGLSGTALNANAKTIEFFQAKHFYEMLATFNSQLKLVIDDGDGGKINIKNLNSLLELSMVLKMQTQNVYELLS